MHVDDKGYLRITRSELTGGDWPDKRLDYGPDWEDIVGFVSAVPEIGEEVGVIFEREGQLWGFEDTCNFEGMRGFSYDYSDTWEFRCSPVVSETVTTTRYTWELPL